MQTTYVLPPAHERLVLYKMLFSAVLGNPDTNNVKDAFCHLVDAVMKTTETTQTQKSCMQKTLSI